jgi:hypothetical protein
MAAVIQKCDFATNKTRKEIRSITNNTELSKFTDNTRLSNDDKHNKNHGLDYFIKPSYRRHPINLNNNITDISQKKKRSAYKR